MHLMYKIKTICDMKKLWMPLKSILKPLHYFFILSEDSDYL